MNVTWDEVDEVVPKGPDDADMQLKHDATPSKPVSDTPISREQGGTGFEKAVMFKHDATPSKPVSYTPISREQGGTRFEEAVMRAKEQLAYDARAAQSGTAKLGVDDLNKDIWRQNLDSAFQTLLLQITDVVGNSHRQLALSLSSEYSPKPANDLAMAMSERPCLGSGGALKVEGSEAESDMPPPRLPRVSANSSSSIHSGTRIHPQYRNFSKMASNILVTDDRKPETDPIFAPQTSRPSKDGCTSLKVDTSFSSVFARAHHDEQKPRYHVEDQYSTHGIFQKMARSTTFCNITLIVIVFNAVYFGVAVEWNDAHSVHHEHAAFIIADNVFCLYFTGEILIRMLAFRRTLDCLRDGWFRFDLMLVVFNCTETWIFPILKHLFGESNENVIPVEAIRLTRLLRLTRISRLARSLPEMVAITKSLVAGARAVLSVIMLIATATYMFAILLYAIMANQDDMNDKLTSHTGRSFKSIGNCMWILTIDGTFLLDTHEMLTLLLFSNQWHSVLACFIFLAFVLVSSVTLMNMLVGVLVEVVSEGAISEREELESRLIKNKILDHLGEIDDGDGKITKEELLAVTHDSVWQEVLDSLNIDRLYFTELQAMIFPPGQDGEYVKIDINAVMQLMLMCRCGLPCTVEHMSHAQAALLCTLNEVTCHLEDDIASRCNQIESLVKIIERRTRERGASENLSQAPAPTTNLRECADDVGPTLGENIVAPSNQSLGISFDNVSSDSKENKQNDADENRWDI